MAMRQGTLQSFLGKDLVAISERYSWVESQTVGRSGEECSNRTTTETGAQSSSREKQ